MRTLLVSLSLVAAIAPAASAQGSLAHAKQLYDARNWDAAKQEYASLARATPNDVTPVLYLGKIAMSQSDTEEAIRQFERCVAIDDRNPDCHAWLGNALGTAAQHTSKFKLPFLAKRTKKEFDRAIELDPGHVEGRSGELQYYLYAPGFLGGSADKAREQAAEIEKRDKWRGALAQGMISDHEKDAKASELAYQRAIAVAPDSVAGYNGLVNLYVREKRWSDAFATLDRVSARIPTELNVPLAIARVAYLSGEQLQRGEEAAKHWIANSPATASINSKAQAHLRLGQIYEKTSRKELARLEFEQALAINPKLEDARKALDALK
jgi:tetratricopeptide (TPR) repeat protein